MDHVGSLGKRMMATIGYENPEDATWHCPTCGPVVPYQLKATGRYMQAYCACEKTAAQAQEVWRSQHLIDECYNWLGLRWAFKSDQMLAQKTFDTFETHLQPEAVTLVKAFADIMTGTLVLYGSFGTGKTHLLAALCNLLRARGIQSRFVTAPKLFAAIGGRVGLHEDYTEFIQKAARTPLLIIDDIDKSKPSDFREEVYYAIIDERTTAGLPLAISTNRVDALANFVGGACASRLAIGQVAVAMHGKDYRQRL